MNQPTKALKLIPVEMPMTKPLVSRERVVWPWVLRSEARDRDKAECRSEYLDTEHLERVLEARTIGGHAEKTGKKRYHVN